MTDIAFSVQGHPESAQQWAALARRVDDEGFARLYCADHPGSTVSPVPALAAAATSCAHVGLGALVMNAGVHEPFDLAADAAALDLLSGGRAVLGLGAGHTPAEWAQVGRRYPSAIDRVGHYLEVVDVVRALLAGGPVRFDGRYVHIDAPGGLVAPRHGDIPLLLGGNGRRLLTYAARHADIIGLSGLGRTLPDGHHHEVAWRAGQIDQRLELIRSATPVGRTPVLEALVQHVEITDDAEAALADWAGDDIEGPAAELLEAPYVLIGTVREIAAKIRWTAEHRGITAYAVRAPVIDQVAQIRRALGHG